MVRAVGLYFVVRVVVVVRDNTTENLNPDS